MEKQELEEEMSQTLYMRKIPMMKKPDEQEIKHMKVKYTFSR